MKNVSVIFGILGALLFISASILGGLQIEGYSFIRHYISESYDMGLPNTGYLRCLYIASGVLFALFGFTISNATKKIKGSKIGFFLFAVFYGFGTILTGYFPCDIGCNPDPEKASLSQFIHNTVGFFVYAMVPFCIVGIGFVSKNVADKKAYAKFSIGCGIIAFAFVVLLVISPTGVFRGLFQRVIEGSILFWVVYTALTIRRKTN